MGGIVITVLATIALHYSGVPAIYALANCAVGITWAFVIPYLLGMAAEFDRAGQMAALGGFASKMGLASGPAVAAILLGDSNYPLIINIGAVVLLLSLLLMLVPAVLLDREVRNEI